MEFLHKRSGKKLKRLVNIFVLVIHGHHAYINARQEMYISGNRKLILDILHLACQNLTVSSNQLIPLPKF